MPSPEDIILGIHDLVSLPAVYFKVKRILEDPRASIGDLATALSHDPAITARVLRIVNSPFFGLPRRIETVTRAVVLLGMQGVHDIVLTWAVSASLRKIPANGLSLRDFWSGSVLRAVTARRLAKRGGFLDAERLFVEGLLSDIGRLLMHCGVPELAARAELEQRVGTRPRHEIEREVVGCDYAELGAAFVCAWNLPETFFEPIACQIDPSTAQKHAAEASILHVAGALAAARANGEGQVATERIHPFALSALALDQEGLEEIFATAKDEFEEVVATLFPDLCTTA